MLLSQQEVGTLNLLCNRKLFWGRQVDLARVNQDHPPAWSTRIWLYLSLNLNARLYASREKDIENLSVDLALPDCALYNFRAVSNEEEDNSSARPFVLEPSSDENLFAIQATSENILDPDSLLQPPHQTRAQSAGMDYLRIPGTSLAAGRLLETQEKNPKSLAEIKNYLEKKNTEHQDGNHKPQNFFENGENNLA